jgi:predicted metal-binding membrane protein
MTALAGLAALVGLHSIVGTDHGAVGGAGEAWRTVSVHSHDLQPGFREGLFASWLVVVLMWQAMMVAMMAPLVVPWLRMAGILHASPRRSLSWTKAWFAAGYFGAWLVYSLAAATAQLALQRGALLDGTLTAGAGVGGGVLLAAGVFQFTALKHRCLKHCRSPFGYFLARWNERPPSAFRVGIGHGLYCVGCCWMLMTVSFAVGVMNLAGMAAIGAAAAVEQMAPGGHHIARAIGIVLIAGGVWLLAQSGF